MFEDKPKINDILLNFISYTNPGHQLMNGGSLVSDTWYPIKAFMTEDDGKDYIRITYNIDGGVDATNWAGMLQNLKSGEIENSV